MHWFWIYITVYRGESIILFYQHLEYLSLPPTHFEYQLCYITMQGSGFCVCMCVCGGVTSREGWRGGVWVLGTVELKGWISKAAQDKHEQLNALYRVSVGVWASTAVSLCTISPRRADNVFNLLPVLTQVTRAVSLPNKFFDLCRKSLCVSVMD